jgi:hypothetical protein
MSDVDYRTCRLDVGDITEAFPAHRPFWSEVVVPLKTVGVMSTRLNT